MKKEFFYRVLVIICCALLLSSFIPAFLYDCLKLYDVANSIDWLYDLLPFGILGLLLSVFLWIRCIIKTKEEYAEISDVWIYEDRVVPAINKKTLQECYIRVYRNNIYWYYVDVIIGDSIFETETCIRFNDKEFWGTPVYRMNKKGRFLGTVHGADLKIKKGKLTIRSLDSKDEVILFGPEHDKRGFLEKQLSIIKYYFR